MDATHAAKLAEEYLAVPLPRRWAHVQSVADAARHIAPMLDGDGELLVSAAWLHDIGYAPDLAHTGFHPLDGARFLRGLGAPERLVGLVAHHSASMIEAEDRELAGSLLAEFAPEESATTDALWYCDLTTGPDGQRFPVEQRMAEIQQRYGPGHLVTRFIDRARPTLLPAVRRTEARLDAAGLAHPM